MIIKTSKLLAATILSAGMIAANPALAIDATAGGPSEADATVGAPGDIATTYALERMEGLDVYTSGGVEIGTVESVDVEAGILIVSVASSQRSGLNGAEVIAVHASEVDIDRVLDRGRDDPGDGRYSFVTTETRVVLNATIDDLQTAVTAVVAAP